jgi:hypothetical protein
MWESILPHPVQGNIKHNNRLTEYTEKRIGDYQNGFTPNRGAMDDIHIFKQITEKAYEYNTQTDILSIDFKHAFDSIYRHKMIKILQLQGISSKLIRLIRITHEDSQAKVVIQKNKTENFNVNVGVGQGDTCISFLFNLVMDYIIKN